MTDEATLADLARGVDLALISRGSPFVGRYGDEPVVMVRSGDGVHALSARCTHLFAPLEQGLVADGMLRCPWHHARFSLATGEAVGAPAFDPLTGYHVEVRDGRAYVTGPVEAPSAHASSEPEDATRVVVVGGGAGGHACVEWLVRKGFAGRITLVSDDADPPYDRTFCSKDYLEGKAPRSWCPLDDESGFYDDPRLDLRLRTRAVALDLRTRGVLLESGERVDYDVLVLATGGEPSRPAVAGLDAPNVHLLRTLRDADALIAEAQPGKRVAVLGGSFIALEAAAAMVERGLQVHLVAPEDLPLGKVLGEQVGRLVQRMHAERGVVFHLGRRVERFDGRRLELDDGSALDVDFVVVGAGVTPRTDLASAAGLKVDDGVVVDDRLRASEPGVYALGDIARFPDPLGGRLIRVEHWVHAQRQGQHVARAILGEDRPFEEPPFFWSAHYGAGIRYVGHAEQFDSVEIDGSLDASPATGSEFVIRYLEGGRVLAVAGLHRDRAVLEAEAGLEARLASRPAEGAA